MLDVTKCDASMGCYYSFLCLNPIILVVLNPDCTTGSLHSFLKIHRLKKKELLIQKTWIELKGIMLSEKCPFQRVLQCTIPFV